MMMMAPPSPPLGQRRSFRILLADDNAMIRLTVRGLLQSLGHSVDVVTNGREALEMTAREDFDFVFLDVQMPEMGGFEAAGTIRRERPRGHLPRIIGLSAGAEWRDGSEAAGMDEFLLKPIRLADLDQVMRHSQGIEEP